MHTSAIVLAAGSGKRMGTEVKKQYLMLKGYPLIYYALSAFEKSFIDEVILVTSSEDKDYMKTELVEKYGFHKVKRIVAGGKERCNSVLCGLEAIENTDYVFIHDGARPLLSEDILIRCLDAVRENGACVAGMPSKDTVKIASEDNYVKDTPNRSLVWNIQTPQVFSYELILNAYKSVLAREEELRASGINITDDAMILECFDPSLRIKLVEGAYTNIKVTTPEDLELAGLFLG